MDGKSATANNKDDLIQTEGTVSNVTLDQIYNGMKNRTYTLTVTTQYCHDNRSLLKEPRSVSITMYIGSKPGSDEKNAPENCKLKGQGLFLYNTEIKTTEIKCV